MVWYPRDRADMERHLAFCVSSALYSYCCPPTTPLVVLCFIFTKHDPFVFRTSTDVTIFVGFVSKWFQSGVPYVARFSRLSIFIIATSVFSNVYLPGFHGFSRTWFVPMSFDLGSYLFFFQRILFWYQKLVNIFWNMYQ